MGDADDPFELPPFWLVHALTWPARVDHWSLARAALVWAPSLAGPLPRAAMDVRYVAEVYRQVYGGRVVFFSDLDGFLDEEGTSWRERRTEPREALDQLLQGDLHVSTRLLLISWYAHEILTRNPRAPNPGINGTPIPEWHREAVRRAIAVQLAADCAHAASDR